jgi:uncharacterized protein
MKTLAAILSERCNLNCTYCHIDKKSEKRLELDSIYNNYLALREEFPDEDIRIDLHGGEPLIQWDLIQDVVNLTISDPKVKYSMTTNGLLLSKDKRDWLESRRCGITLSYDGLWQDSNRQQFSGAGTNQYYLRKADLFEGLKIHTMITRGNYNLLENHHYITNVMGSKPELTLVRDIGTWDAESVEKLKAGIDELFQWYINNPEEDIPSLIHFYLMHVIVYKAKGYEMDTCGASVDYWAVDQNQKVPCTRFTNEPETIAKIPEFTKMLPCHTCEVKNYCRKGCLYEQIHNDGPIEELCEIYKYIYKNIFIMLERLKHHNGFVNMIKEAIENEF